MKKSNIYQTIALTTATLGVVIAASSTRAADIAVTPGLDMSDVVFDGQANRSYEGSDKLQIRLRASCFGVNLRSVSNPLSNRSSVTMTLNLTKPDGSPGAVRVTFPAMTTLGKAPEQSASVTTSGFPGTASAGIVNSTVVIYVPGAVDVKAGLNEQMQVQVDRNVSKFKGMSFHQNVPSLGPGEDPGQYMGVDGPLSSQTHWAFSNNGSVLDIHAAFPGQNGFCGGYFSPLMVLFSDKRPSFKETSAFPLNPLGGNVYWPEADSDYAWLALDRNKNGSIDNGLELFGQTEDEKFKNGFERLKEFDKNGDGVINAKDKVFEKLVLWTDTNGDGKSQASELTPLKKAGIVSISLKYDGKTRTPIGNRAEWRERTHVTMKDKKTGKLVKRDIIDVWLAPAYPEPTATLAKEH